MTGISRSIPMRTALCALLLLGAACAKNDATPPADSATAAPAADAVATTEPAPAPAASTATATAPPAAVEAPADDTSASDASLERLTQLPAQDQLPAGKWQAGRNYTPLVPAQPTNVGPGKVEVIEVFWYGCSHCFALEPFLDSWSKNKPAYVEFMRVPVTWAPWHKSHARLYYTLAALKRLDLHSKVFQLSQPGGGLAAQESEEAMLKAQLAFAKANGIREADFLKESQGFSVTTAMQRAEQLVKRYQVEGTPFMVVNGKYTTDVGAAGGHSQLVQLLNDLAASEKRR